MLLLLKLRTSGCVIVGALCVVLSVFEPVRWLPWDMLAAVVVCMVTVRFVLRQRVAAALAVPVEEEQADDYPSIAKLPKQIRNYFIYVAFEPGLTPGRQRKYEHADNFRMASLNDPEALVTYQRRYHHGCCGSRDEVIEDDGGNLWVVGFNYGH